MGLRSSFSSTNAAANLNLTVAPSPGSAELPAGRIRTPAMIASVPLAAYSLAEALSNVYDVEAKKIAFIVAEDGKILKTE
jgi:hypothetical protein